MGEYFHIVCHTCRKQHQPNLLKYREIFLNESVAAEVGRFATQHIGHILELRGDEYNYLHEYPRSCIVEYEPTSEREVQNLRNGIEE